MAPRNSQNALSNKTLRTACAGCGAETPSEVGNDPAQRKTWSLVGSENGISRVFAACTACYSSGWRPPGYASN
ncbi:MAG: hypothetical protein ACI8TX_002443 [Hyphomicrobiaceae bacterium]|jgi:hypothetical protein